MGIFELVIPGSMIEPFDEKTSLMLDKLVSVFFEANAALILFNNAKQPQPFPSSMREDMLAKSLRKSEIKTSLFPDADNVRDIRAQMAMEDQVELAYKREQWAAGIAPRQITMHVAPITARAFLYALDTFDRCLESLSLYPDVQRRLKDISLEFKDRFPDLRGVRNSAHHQEDRAVGMITKDKPLVPLPIQNGSINSAGGVLVSSTLIGVTYRETMADGNLGSVEVSEESMHKFQETLSAVLDAFEWVGPVQHRPFG